MTLVSESFSIPSLPFTNLDFLVHFHIFFIFCDTSLKSLGIIFIFIAEWSEPIGSGTISTEKSTFLGSNLR